MNYQWAISLIRFFIFFIFSLLPAFLLSFVLRQKKGEFTASVFICHPLIISYSIFLLAYSSFSANFATVFCWLLILMIFLILMTTNCRKADYDWFSFVFVPDKVALAFFLPFALLLFFRALFQPMISPDSVFRWEHLAELIFKTGRLNFYPPSSIFDFIIYPYPDGFPPFVSAIYAFFYICAGGIFRGLTSISVLIQFSLCAFFVYNASMMISGEKKAARISLLVLLASPFFFFSLFLGQETGWTAVSASAFFFYLLKAVNHKEHAPYLLVLASFSLVIGALSREYGMIFIFLSPLLMYYMAIDRKMILKTFLLSFILALPFYLRNIVFFGNPVYPLFLLPGLDHNTVHTGIMNIYSKQFSVYENPRLLIDAFKLSLLGLPLQMLALILSLKERKFLPFCIFSIAIIILWAFSTGYTCGALFYSMRVLSPFIVCISIPAGIIFANFAKNFPKLFRVVMPVFVILSFLSCVCLPRNFYEMPPAKWLKAAFGKQNGIEAMVIKYVATLPDDSLVLTDSALYSAYLYRNGDRRVRLIPIWSPELNFLFDEKVSFAEKISLLKEAGILYIMHTNESANNDFF